MSRWKLKRKKWLDRHSRAGNQKKRRSIKARVVSFSNTRSSHVQRSSNGNKAHSVTLIPPNNFSLINNADETMTFFMDFAKEIEAKEYGKHFFIDSGNVEKVTVDSLIYLIAILQNHELNITMKYSFSGNYPKNSNANRVYAESGFNEYVNSHMKSLPKSNEKMCIVNGTGNRTEISKELCDFVMEKIGKSRSKILPLQKVLIELMSNVYYHAYEKNTFMAKKWYMYAEHIDDYVRCVFVDTGQGIAKTVRKNFGEKIKTIVGFGIDDSMLIKSAFNGDFRTSTNKRYRGNGLCSVKANVGTDLFDGLEVLSGHGRCILPKGLGEEIMTENYKGLLYGTLYTFILR